MVSLSILCDAVQLQSFNSEHETTYRKNKIYQKYPETVLNYSKQKFDMVVNTSQAEDVMDHLLTLVIFAF